MPSTSVATLDRPARAARKAKAADPKQRALAFALLGDPSRLRVLEHLRSVGETHVGGLCAVVGLSQPALSHHLALLRHAGVVVPRRAGKQNFYGLNPDHPVAAILEACATAGR